MEQRKNREVRVLDAYLTKEDGTVLEEVAENTPPELEEANRIAAVEEDVDVEMRE
jgi:hypothetical protein